MGSIAKLNIIVKCAYINGIGANNMIFSSKDLTTLGAVLKIFISVIAVMALVMNHLRLGYLVSCHSNIDKLMPFVTKFETLPSAHNCIQK